MEGATTVTIGGAPATSVVVTSSTSLIAVTPPGTVGLAEVVAITDAGSGTMAGGFTYLPLVAPLITASPMSIRRAVGRAVCFEAAAEGMPVPTVQWQVKLAGSSTWTDIPGAITASYTFAAAAGESVRQYRAVFTNVAGSAATNPATLTVVAPGIAGDINGDGSPDLLWTNLVNGATAVWHIAGAVRTGIGELPAEPDTAWRLVGSADFDGDGLADLLWHNISTGASRVWLMDGETQVGTASLEDEPDLDWALVGSSDFNLDWIPDLLWRNVATGENRVRYLDTSLSRTGVAALEPMADLNWTFVAARSAGNGTTDLYWRNGATGANRMTCLYGVELFGYSTLPAEPDPTWAIIGVADFNADRWTEVMWRNVTIGSTRLWRVTWPTPIVSNGPGPLTDFAWSSPGAGLVTPAEPSALTASSTDSSILLSWAPPTAGAAPTGYVIDAGSGPGLSDLGSFPTGSTATSIAALGIPPRLYWVRVRATNGAGSSGPSNEALLVVGPAPPPAPGAPTGLTGWATGSSLTLSWTPAGEGGTVVSYVIEAGSMPGLADLASHSTGSPATSFSVTGVPDGLYYLRIRAANASGLSAPSNEFPLRVGTPPALPPGIPGGLTASVDGAVVTLTWKAPATGSAPTTYRIEVGYAPGLTNFATISTGNTATAYTAGGVYRGTYYVRVRAANDAGVSMPSNEAVVIVGCTATPAAPANFRVTSNSGGIVAFAWDPPPGPINNAPTSYTLSAGLSPGSWYLGSIVLGPQTTYIVSGVPAGTYYARVLARNQCGSSPVSNEVVVIVR